MGPDPGKRERPVTQTTGMGRAGADRVPEPGFGRARPVHRAEGSSRAPARANSRPR